MNRADKHKCTCTHTYQDELHGKQVRVCTPCKSTSQTTRDIRCTVCQKIHTIPR